MIKKTLLILKRRPSRASVQVVLFEIVKVGLTRIVEYLTIIHLLLCRSSLKARLNYTSLSGFKGVCPQGEGV